MKKIIDWIMKYPRKTIWIIIGMIVGPLFLVQILFKIPAPCEFLEAV